jgi:hypothetical protein
MRPSPSNAMTTRFALAFPTALLFALFSSPLAAAAAPLALHVLASCDGSILITLNAVLWLQVSITTHIPLPLPPPE